MILVACDILTNDVASLQKSVLQHLTLTLPAELVTEDSVHDAIHPREAAFSEPLSVKIF